MAKKKITAELEEAILGLPQKEKHKLLLRLINKDSLLTEQLQYKLLENTEADLRYRVQVIKDSIDATFGLPRMSLKDILAYTREKVGLINRFAKITKDKKGELELLVHLFKASQEAFAQHRATLRDFLLKTRYKQYASSKTAKMKLLLDALHEDYRIEFEEDLNQIINTLNRI
ncbi:MAG: hypothetical protein KF870_05970 [Leadbetterella sp.]|nr:hypothetical protein [Leadbetterella sp.]